MNIRCKRAKAANLIEIEFSIQNQYEFANVHIVATEQIRVLKMLDNWSFVTPELPEKNIANLFNISSEQIFVKMLD